MGGTAAAAIPQSSFTLNGDGGCYVEAKDKGPKVAGVRQREWARHAYGIYRICNRDPHNPSVRTGGAIHAHTAGWPVIPPRLDRAHMQ